MISKPDPKPEKAKRLTGKAKDKLQHEVMMRDNWRCLCCGKDTEAPPHHFLPVSQGGSDVAENLGAVCEISWNEEPGCHYFIHHGDPRVAIDRMIETYGARKVIQYFLMGLIKCTK